MAFSFLEHRKQQAKALFSLADCLPLQEKEIFPTVDKGKTRVQDYAFIQRFALVQEFFQKKQGILLLDCTRHHVTKRNTKNLDKKKRIQTNTKVAFTNCKYQLRLKKTKEETWRLVITNAKHNHPMAIDPFNFKKHHSKDLNWAKALDHAGTFRNFFITYGQVIRTLQIRGFCLSKNDSYNLVWSEGSYLPEEKLQFALGMLKFKGFYVCCIEKYLVENNQPQQWVVKHFFFCNKE